MSSQYKQKLLELSILQNYNDFSTEELVEMLKCADEFYFNDSAIITDEEYDTLKRIAFQNDRFNDYFKAVGVQVRTGKVKLPVTMGSLDQLYNDSDLLNWKSKLGTKCKTFVVSEKLDGISGLVTYDINGNFLSSFSRGDGVEGAVIDRHVTKLQDVPLTSCIPNGIIRGEIIFSKDNFSSIASKIKTKGGTSYKNARNCIAGLMNAETNDSFVYDFIDFVAYEIVGDSRSKVDQLLTLKTLGFKTPLYSIIKPEDFVVDVLKNIISQARLGAYEIDGVVVDINEPDARIAAQPSKDTLNPAYAIKFKTAADDNCAVTSVVDVEWSPSKHGYLKPVVVFEPVELCGVTITRATGFNAGFIRDNGIGFGSQIEIVRSGDVIPFINRVLTHTTPILPTVDWEWNETEVDAVLINPELHDTVKINRIVDFFSTLSVSHLKEGNVKTLYNSGLTTVASIINASEKTLVDLLGENGTKVFRSIRSKLSNIHIFELIGAHSTQRGIGVRKIKKLFNSFKDKLLHDELSVEEISSVDGFDAKTALTAKNALESFKPFLEEIQANVTFISDTNEDQGDLSLRGNVYVFTGFRDNNLERKIENAGGAIATGVSKKVTAVIAKDVSENSTKIQKATQLGITIMSLETFLAYIEDSNI